MGLNINDLTELLDAIEKKITLPGDSHTHAKSNLLDDSLVLCILFVGSVGLHNTTNLKI